MKFYRRVLSNGLRLITIPRSGSNAVTLFVVLKVGSRHEDSRRNGLSHFIEHMMFKGTTKRANTLELSKTLDQVGAEYNAFTAKDHTAYYIKVNKSKTRLALDVLSDMLTSSKFEAAEIEREKGVVIEEINMYEDNPLMFVEDVFEQTVFGRNNPLGRIIAGPRPVIRSLNRKKVVDYYQQHYLANNAVVVLAGAVDASLAKNVEKYFRTWRRGRAHRNQDVKNRRQASPRLAVKYKKTEQVQLCLGFPALSYTDRRLPSLELLNVILGGNMSSRLFISIRERKGLAYFIHSSISPYEDTGTFYVQAGLDRNRVTQAVSAILEELAQVKRKGITLEELAKAKQYIKGRMALELEESSRVASWFGRQEILTRRIETPERRLKKLMAVPGSALKELAQAIFRPSRLNIACIGPLRQPSQLEKAIKGGL